MEDHADEDEAMAFGNELNECKTNPMREVKSRDWSLEDKDLYLSADENCIEAEPPCPPSPLRDNSENVGVTLEPTYVKLERLPIHSTGNDGHALPFSVGDRNWEPPVKILKPSSPQCLPALTAEEVREQAGFAGGKSINTELNVFFLRFHFYMVRVYLLFHLYCRSKTSFGCL